VKGEDWEEGFSLGLMNSLVALPLLSAGVLGPLEKLKGAHNDHQDNVLKELIIMQALLGTSGRLEAIYPVLVGKHHIKDDPKYPCSGDFFRGCSGQIHDLPESSSPPTTDSVVKFLSKFDIVAPSRANFGSVKGTVQELLSLQGAQLWVHSPNLPKEAISEDSDIALRLQSDPPNPPFDHSQLCMLKAELRALVPAMHEVIDRSHAKHLDKWSKPQLKMEVPCPQAALEINKDGQDPDMPNADQFNFNVYASLAFLNYN
jgi:hypothetical protein